MPHQCTNCGRTFDDGSKEMLSGCPDCGGNKFQFKPGRASSDETGGSADAGSTASDSGRASGESHGASGPETEGSQARPSDSPDRIEPDETGFQAADPEPAADADPEPAADADPEPATGSEPAARDPVTKDDSAGDDIPDLATSNDGDDDAQADARSAFVSEEELDRAREQMAQAEEERMAEVGDTTGAGQADGTSSGGAPDQEPTAEAARSLGPDSDEIDAEELEPEVEDPNLDALREELNSQFESIKIVAPGEYELNLMELYDRQEYIISLREDGRYVIEVPETWGVED